MPTYVGLAQTYIGLMPTYNGLTQTFCRFGQPFIDYLYTFLGFGFQAAPVDLGCLTCKRLSRSRPLLGRSTFLSFFETANSVLLPKVPPALVKSEAVCHTVSSETWQHAACAIDAWRQSCPSIQSAGPLFVLDECAASSGRVNFPFVDGCESVEAECRPLAKLLAAFVVPSFRCDGEETNESVAPAGAVFVNCK